LFIFPFLILSISDVKAKNCLDFLPFGHNSDYVHLPLKSEFCVKYGKKNLKFKTDHLGGRIFSTSNNKIQIFGDSQVLGLDLDTQNKHYLNNYYSKDFVIYAAPNNGPYEVLKFIYKNRKEIEKKIIINFNLSVDLFRLYADWDIKNFVALKSDDLNEILKNPLKYKLIISKSLLTNKFFTISRKNDKEMRDLFMSSNEKQLERNIYLYLSELEKISKELNIEIDYILTMPYWLYISNNNKIRKISLIEKKIKKIICNTFQKKNINTKISGLKNTNNFLTLDKRHLKSDNITLTSLSKYCNIKS